jgi:hypothetical protein
MNEKKTWQGQFSMSKITQNLSKKYFWCLIRQRTLIDMQCFYQKYILILRALFFKNLHIFAVRWISDQYIMPSPSAAFKIFWLWSNNFEHLQIVLDVIKNFWPCSKFLNFFFSPNSFHF